LAVCHKNRIFANQFRQFFLIKLLLKCSLPQAVELMLLAASGRNQGNLKNNFAVGESNLQDLKDLFTIQN
jgi:hypothetical protein